MEKEAFSDNQNKILYSIIRKDDNFLIGSYDVSFTDTGIWINDDLETGSDKLRCFIPWHNVLQINEYSE